MGLLLVAIKTQAGDLDNVEAGQLVFTDLAGGDARALHVNTDVEIMVSGFVARVEVTQKFINHTDEWQEAVYVFPLPDTAAVNFMRMKIGDRLIKAEVQEKQKAQQIYQAAKSQGKKAALTEQSRANMFTQSVANIAPGEIIEVKLRYIQSVAYQSGEFSLRFPMTLTSRFIPGQTSAAFNQQDYDGAQIDYLIPRSHTTRHAMYRINNTGWALPTSEVPDAHFITPPMIEGSPNKIDNPVSVQITLDAGLPIKDINSPYHDIIVAKSNDQHHISLRKGTVSMDRDFLLTWLPTNDHSPTAAVFKETVEAEDYVLLMMLPPRLSTNSPVMPRDMIFVIDTSGSMKGPSINQAKQSLKQTLSKLRPQDRFNIIEFSSSARQLFPSSKTADEYSVDQAMQWVSYLSAGGGTNMYDALRLALESPASESYLKHIVFVTDGAVGNEASLFKIIHQHLGQSRLFTVGIGSAPNSFFMRKAAEFGGGTFTHIGMMSEITDKMNRLYEKLDHPVVKNIQIDWPQNVESYPDRLPSLYMGEPLLVVAKTENLQGEIYISGTMAQLPWQQFLTVDNDYSHPGIGTLWARAKIESLEDQKITGRDPAEIKREIV